MADRDAIVTANRSFIDSRYPFNQSESGEDLPVRGMLCKPNDLGPDTLVNTIHGSRSMLMHGDCARTCIYWTPFQRQTLTEWPPDPGQSLTLDPPTALPAVNYVTQLKWMGASMAAPNRMILHKILPPNLGYWQAWQFSGDHTATAFPATWSIQEQVETGQWWRGLGNPTEPQRTQKFHLGVRCRRILVYKNITHDGTTYDTDTLRDDYIPAYVMRPGKAWIKQTSHGDIAGDTRADVRFEPWGWGTPDLPLTFRTWLANLNDIPGEFQVEYPMPRRSAYISTSEMQDIMDNLDGSAVFKHLNNFGMRTWEEDLNESNLDASDFPNYYFASPTKLSDLVDAGEKHHLILEMHVIYRYKLQVKLKSVKTDFFNDWVKATGYEVIDLGFHSIAGRAYVII